MICRPRRMIYNTAGVDDIHAVRDDIRTPNAVFFFISLAAGCHLFWTERGCTKCQPPTTRALSQVGGGAVNFLIMLQNPHPEPRMVQSGVRTPNVVFFFYFFGSGVSFVLDGAWLHEVPAPDNAGVVASWRRSRQLFNHAPAMQTARV